MNRFFERFREVAGGYGGMLFISVLGLSILIFGGILTNARSEREIQASIDEMEQALEDQESLTPIVSLIDSRKRELRSQSLDAPVEDRLGSDDIPRLKTWFESMTEAAGLKLVSARHFLETDDKEDISLRVEIRTVGEFADFREFLLELLAWEYAVEIEGFSLRAVETEQEMQVILHMDVI